MDGRPGTRVEGGWGFEGAPHGGVAPGGVAGRLTAHAQPRKH